MVNGTTAFGGCRGTRDERAIRPVNDVWHHRTGQERLGQRKAAGMARDADATRRRILDAALEEFAEKGLAGARVDLIAERAGSSTRMLYVYFGSKEELYDEVLRQHVAQRASALAGGKRPLAEFIVQHFEALASDERFARLVVWESLTTEGPVTGEDDRVRRYAEIADYLAE